MAGEYISRAAIGLRAPNGSHQLVPSQVRNFAWHYPGMASPINASGDAGLARVKSALRGWQAYHMDSRGWSDIAYCVAVDQVGRKYTLRGINIRSAANGGTQVNLEYGAALLVLGNNEEPSAAMKAAAREVAGDYRVRFSRIPRRPTWHGAIRPGGTASDPSTDCPGKRAIAQIKAGKFDAGSSPTQPPVPEDDDMKFTDAVPGMKNPDGSPTTVQQALMRGGGWAYDVVTDGGWVSKMLQQHQVTLHGENGVIDILVTLDKRIKALVADDVRDDAAAAETLQQLEALKAKVAELEVPVPEAPKG